jgi:signal transduction histidine kinase
VNLSVAAVPGPGGRAAEVHVVVADTGRGMTEAELARAFEPFFTTKANGTGLGLAICRQVMVRHGGDIWLSSAPGRGTTATLVFPEPGT